jgi:hypothetical protein
MGREGERHEARAERVLLIEQQDRPSLSCRLEDGARGEGVLRWPFGEV